MRPLELKARAIWWRGGLKGRRSSAISSKEGMKSSWKMEGRKNLSLVISSGMDRFLREYHTKERGHKSEAYSSKYFTARATVSFISAASFAFSFSFSRSISSRGVIPPAAEGRFPRVVREETSCMRACARARKEVAGFSGGSLESFEATAW